MYKETTSNTRHNGLYGWLHGWVTRNRCPVRHVSRLSLLWLFQTSSPIKVAYVFEEMCKARLGSNSACKRPWFYSTLSDSAVPQNLRKDIYMHYARVYWCSEVRKMCRMTCFHDYFTISLLCRFGRKHALMTSIILHIVSNIAVSFVTDFWVFSTLRIFSGVSVGGLVSTTYVMGK